MDGKGRVKEGVMVCTKRGGEGSVMAGTKWWRNGDGGH